MRTITKYAYPWWFKIAAVGCFALTILFVNAVAHCEMPKHKESIITDRGSCYDSCSIEESNCENKCCDRKEDYRKKCMLAQDDCMTLCDKTWNPKQTIVIKTAPSASTN